MSDEVIQPVNPPLPLKVLKVRCSGSVKCKTDCPHKYPHDRAEVCRSGCPNADGIMTSTCVAYSPVKRYQVAKDIVRELQEQLQSLDEYVGLLVKKMQEAEVELEAATADLSPDITPEELARIESEKPALRLAKRDPLPLTAQTEKLTAAEIATSKEWIGKILNGMSIEKELMKIVDAAHEL